MNHEPDRNGVLIAVGDRVRSHDFPDRLEIHDREPCYAEGIVEAIGEDVLEGSPRYRIRVLDHVFAGKSVAEFDAYVYPPLNGTPTFLGKVCRGVEKIPTDEHKHKPKRHLACCVCGGDAGRFEQWWNRDKGYGCCAACIAWQKADGMSDEELRDLYGVAGVNYEAPKQ